MAGQSSILEEPKRMVASTAEPKKASYFKIKMSNKQNKNESDTVPLQLCDRVPLQIKRGSTMILPVAYIEILEHAIEVQEQTHLDPKTGEPFIERQEIVQYPFTILGEATKEEYEEQMRGVLSKS